MQVIDIVSSDGELIRSSLHPECSLCRSQSGTGVMQCPRNRGKRRKSRLTNSFGSIWECSDVHGYVASEKAHIGSLENRDGSLLPILARLKAKLLESLEKRYTRLQHNLVSSNTHIIQEFLAVVPEDKFLESKDPLGLLRTTIERSSYEAAQAMFKMYLGAIGIKHEIYAYEMLDGLSGQMKPGRHRLHKVFMQTFYKFRQDFMEREVRVNIEKFAGEVFVDYSAAAVVLYCILHNAAKYTCPKSIINVRFLLNGHRNEIRLEMESLLITATDLLKIFEEGYCGEHAKLSGQYGDGYGMHIVKRVSGFADIDVAITPGADIIRRVGAVCYAMNIFTVSFRSPGH